MGEAMDGVRMIEVALRRYDGCPRQSEYNELEDSVRTHLQGLLIRLDGDRTDGAVQVARQILGPTGGGGSPT